MPAIRIVKSDGVSEPFDIEKLRAGLRRAHTPADILDRIANAVSERVREGTTTRQISQMVHRQLRREHLATLYRYTLRDALLKLGPAGFRFEKYVASILQAYGYAAELPEELQGACVRHEVDVVARKDGRTIMIEAKFRNDFSYFVRLKDVLATWARYLDLREGAEAGTCPKFDEVWIVTNGKISSRSQKFGACKGIRLLGWNHPKDASLAKFVDHTSLYPVTALHDLKSYELDRLAAKDLMLCRQVAASSPKRLARRIGIQEARAGRIVDACRQVITHEPDEPSVHPKFDA
jgi:Holliday junction resolvase